MSDNTDRSESEAIPEDVAARFALIESRIAQPLHDDQANEVRKRIARSIALGVALRRFPLSNADEPEIALVPFRGGER
jgi:hypothetical protein